MLLRTLSIFAALAWLGAILALFHNRLTRTSQPPVRTRHWERLSYGLLLIGMAILAVTGFGTVLETGPGSISGWALWLHVAAAPLFIVGLLLIVLAWGERSRFDAVESKFSCAARFWFWVVAFSGFGAMASILLSMTPLFPSENQATLVMIHRYCALVLVFAAALQAIALLQAEAKAPAPHRPLSATPS